MNDSLGVDIPQGTSQFGDPEADSILGEGFPSNMESEIAAIHEIDDNVALQKSAEGRNRDGEEL